MKKDEEEEKTTGYIEAIEEKMGRKLTEEELNGIHNGPPDDSLDTITSVNEG